MLNRIEYLGINLHRVSQDFGVDSGNTIDNVATDNGQMSHVHSLLALFLNQRHTPKSV